MSSDVDSSTHPRDARAKIRRGTMFGFPTSGMCGGFLQANITILPLELARDFAEFCRINSAPCPLLYSSKPGEVEAPPLAQDSDIRTDLPKYYVVKDGQLVKEAGDLIDQKWCDLVTFYLGCSFTFEQFLIDAGIPVQHIQLNRNVPMSMTNIPCYPVGQFSCNLVVSVRPIPRDLVEKTVQITSRCEAVHGAPIHIGDPSKIGISDIYKSDFGDNIIRMNDNDVPLFWACGVTGNMATQSAAPELAFNHSPGCMFICDVKVEDYLQEYPPQHGDLVPRVLFIQEEPAMATIISQTALIKIHNIFKLMKENSNIQDSTLPCDFDIAKVILKLSHLKSVAIVINGLKFDKGLFGIITLLEALLGLDMEVSVFLSSADDEVMVAFQTCFELGIFTQDVNIMELPLEWNTSDYLVSFVCKSISKNDDTRTFKIFDFSNLVPDAVNQTEAKAPLNQTALCLKTSSSEISEMSGFAMMAAGLHHARKCPLHDRYIRRGIGFNQEKEILHLDQQHDEMMKRIGFKEETLSKAKELLSLLLHVH